MAGADAQAPRHDPWKLVAGLVGAFEERSCACVRGWVAGRTLREPSTLWVRCGPGVQSVNEFQPPRFHGAAACQNQRHTHGVSVSVRGVAFACCASVLSENFLLCCIFPTHTNDTRINQVPTMSSLAGRRLRAPQRVMPPCSCVALSLSGSPRPVVVSRAAAAAGGAAHCLLLFRTIGFDSDGRDGLCTLVHGYPGKKRQPDH